MTFAASAEAPVKEHCLEHEFPDTIVPSAIACHDQINAGEMAALAEIGGELEESKTRVAPLREKNGYWRWLGIQFVS
mgnify:CR=1 FL=1